MKLNWILIKFLLALVLFVLLAVQIVRNTCPIIPFTTKILLENFGKTKIIKVR